MSKRIATSSYFADDRDIYELLHSHRQKLTASKLVELARSRGLILSGLEMRDDLARQISIMPFSWQELAKLMEQTDTPERAERTTSRTFAKGVTLSALKAAAELVRDARKEGGELYTIRSNDSNHASVTVAYAELDLSRHRLTQKTQREFTLEFEIKEDGSAVVRHQDQTRAHQVLGAVIDCIATPGSALDGERIELSGLRTPELRIQFFVQLLKNVDGFKADDVKAIKASRFPSSEGSAPDTERTGPEEDVALTLDDGEEEDEDEDADEREGNTEKATFITYVKEIALRGDRVNRSPHYKHLLQHGYFVRAMTWSAQGKNARVVFDAGFDNGEAGTGFTYSIRAVFPKKLDKAEYRRTKTPPDAQEKTKLLRLIEAAAKTALAHVLAEASGPEQFQSEVGEALEEARVEAE